MIRNVEWKDPSESDQAELKYRSDVPAATASNISKRPINSPVDGKRVRSSKHDPAEKPVSGLRSENISRAGRAEPRSERKVSFAEDLQPRQRFHGNEILLKEP